MTESGLVNNNFVIQNLLHKANELTNVSFGSNSKLTVLGEEQYAPLNLYNVNTSSNSTGVKVEEIDEVTAHQIIRSLPTTNVYQHYQSIDDSALAHAAVVGPISALAPVTHYHGELFHDPNGPQILRRPPAHGPVTYRQNVSVRFLQPPPVPPPGPLIIKEVRPVQPPAPPPLVVRQRAPPLPTPPPLLLRERPPQPPTPIPSQTVIKRLPPIPVPPRSVIVERFPAIPPRPRDIIIERWLPYSKEPQRRKVITYRAPTPRPYPQPRNTIVLYEPVQANVVRQVHKVGIQPQNPQEYAFRHGHSLLDGSTLLAQAQSLGINDDLGPPISVSGHQYLVDNSDYYLNHTQTVWEPEPEYTASTWENQAVINNEPPPPQVFWTDPQEDVRVILQRLGLPVA
jgi:hypothetical protein